MVENKKPIHGGNEDGLGIAEDVRQSSAVLNDRNKVTSDAGKILKSSTPTKKHE